MEYLFYSLALFALWYKVDNFFQAEKVHDAVLDAKRKDKKFDNYTDYQHGLATTGAAYFIYCFIGLMSSQWLLFLTLILFGFISKRTVLYRQIDGVISALIVLFIVINKFHLHIDLPALIFN